MFPVEVSKVLQSYQIPFVCFYNKEILLDYIDSIEDKTAIGIISFSFNYGYEHYHNNENQFYESFGAHVTFVGFYDDNPYSYECINNSISNNTSIYQYWDRTGNENEFLAAIIIRKVK